MVRPLQIVRNIEPGATNPALPSGISLGSGVLSHSRWTARGRGESGQYLQIACDLSGAWVDGGLCGAVDFVPVAQHSPFHLQSPQPL